MALTVTNLSICPACCSFPGGILASLPSGPASVYLGQAPVPRACTWGGRQKIGQVTPFTHSMACATTESGHVQVLLLGIARLIEPRGVVARSHLGEGCSPGEAPPMSSLAPHSWLLGVCPWPLVLSPHLRMFSWAAPLPGMSTFCRPRLGRWPLLWAAQVGMRCDWRALSRVLSAWPLGQLSYPAAALGPGTAGIALHVRNLRLTFPKSHSGWRRQIPEDKLWLPSLCPSHCNAPGSQQCRC